MIEGACVPDPSNRLPGRGANLHPVTECLDLAERRRAFARAFRSAGPLDVTRLREYVEGQAARTSDTSSEDGSKR